MPIATTNDTTWDEAGAQNGALPLRVRCYSEARPGVVFVVAEAMLLAAALSVSMAGHRSWEAPILIASCGLFFHLKTLDRTIVSSELARFCMDVLVALSAGALAAALLFALLPGLKPDPFAGLAGIGIAALTPLALRPILRQSFLHRQLTERILIIGTGELVTSLYRILTDSSAASEPKATGDDPPPGVLAFPEVSSDGASAVDLANLSKYVKQRGISRIVVVEQNPERRNNLAAALVDHRLRGIDVTDGVDFYEESFRKIWVEALNSEWFVYSDGFSHSPVTQFFKRACDIVVATLLLVLMAPIFALIAVAIKLNSPGPALFRQTRVGLHGTTFTILKFRSMVKDAEREGGPVWASEHDSRVTRVGYWLRRFRLDEFPQLLNVLCGEMSLVGPRPERPCFVERLEREIPFYRLRHYVRPGITGWAQVMYRYGASIEDAREKLQYDFYYAKHMSLACDLKILLKTIGIVLRGGGR